MTNSKVYSCYNVFSIPTTNPRSNANENKD